MNRSCQSSPAGSSPDTIIREIYRRATPLFAIAFCVLIAGLLTSCNNSGCTDRRSALPLAGLYNATTNDPIILDSIAVGGVDAPGGALLVNSGESTRNIYLPLRASETSTRFFIHYDYTAQGIDDERFNDTITVGYTAQPYFASEECGAFYVYHINSLDYTDHIISHVELTDSVVDNIDLERIRIYFRVAEADEGGEEMPLNRCVRVREKGGCR